MSTGIGDYVHLHTLNYIKYGINPVGAGTKSTANSSTNIATAAKEKLRASIKTMNTVNDQQKILLQSRLMNLMRPPNALNKTAYDKTGGSKEVYDLLWSATVEWLEEQFAEAIGVIDRQSGNIFNPMTVAGVRKIELSKRKEGIQIKTVLSRINAIESLIRSNSQSQIYSSSEIQFLQHCLDDIFAEKDRLEREVMGAWTGQSIYKLIPKDEAVSIVDKINALAILSDGRLNDKKGTLFEGMIAAVQGLALQLGTQSIEDAIEEGVNLKGQIKDLINTSVIGKTGKTTIQLDTSTFGTKIDASKIFSDGYKQVSAYLWESNNATQNKIDVNFRFQPTDSPIKISAKNVNLFGGKSRGVHLVSGMSLLVSLMHLEDSGSLSLANHYLNQHVYTQPLSSRRHFGWGVSLAQQYPDTQIAIKLALFEQALRGYKTSAEKADIFIINENTSGVVQVYNMASILTDMLNNNLPESLVTFNPDPAVLVFKNDYSPISQWDRITNLLAKVHSYKITVTMQPEFFVH